MTTNPADLSTLKESEKTVKDRASFLYDTYEMYNDGREISEHASDFVNSFVNHYEKAQTVEDLINAIEEDIADKDFE